MVADALKIADGVEQGVDALAVSVVQLPAGKLDQISAEGVFILINFAFFLFDLFGQSVVPFVRQAHGLEHTHAGKLSHLGGCGTGTLHSHGRRIEQTLIQQGKALFLSVVRDGQEGQLFKQTCKGEQNHSGSNVERGVDHGNAPGRDGVIDKGEVQHAVQTIENDQEQHDADDVEVQMDHSSPAGILVGTHRGEQCSDASTNILAHDDGDGTAVSDNARGAQGLQDADTGTGGLDDTGNNGTHQHAQNGVGEADKEVGEPGFVLQGSHRVGHRGHAGHQDGKADHDGANALALFVFAHIQQDADKCQHRTERSGFEHLDEQAVALQAGKA